MRPTLFATTTAAALTACLALCLTSSPVGADVDGDRFVSKQWGVSLRAPSHWHLSERTSYPNIVLWMTHSEPAGRMLLSVEVHEKKINARTYALQTAQVLTELGFTVRTPQRHPTTGAWYFDFDNCHSQGNAAKACVGKAFMRQGFLVEGKVGYALTLAANDVYSRGRLLRSWDLALKTIKLDRVVITGIDNAAVKPKP